MHVVLRNSLMELVSKDQKLNQTEEASTHLLADPVRPPIGFIKQKKDYSKCNPDSFRLSNLTFSGSFCNLDFNLGSRIVPLNIISDSNEEDFAGYLTETEFEIFYPRIFPKPTSAFRDSHIN